MTMDTSTTEKVTAVVRKHPRLFAALLIFLVVLLAYGQTLQMYIWQDDHAVMFKLQHLGQAAGHFGTGLYDKSSAYRGVLVPLAPLYHVFGLNTSGYYAAGLVVYFIAALSVYLLAKTLTGHGSIAFAASLIFAAGYIGAETMWRIFNSIHTSHTIIFLCLTLVTYKKFIDSGKPSTKLFLYFISLLLFAYTIETGFVRAHGIFFLILGLEILFNFNIVRSLFYMLPFFYIYYHLYIKDNVATHELPILFDKMFLEQNFYLLSIPLENIKNIFIPSQFEFPLLIFLLFFMGALVFAKSKILWYTPVLILASYLVYFIHTPEQIFSSTHRYFSLPLIGFSIFAAVFLNQLFRDRKRYFVGIAIIVVFHLITVNIEHSNFISERSIPAKKFYNALKMEVPALPIGSALFFDVGQDAKSNSRFEEFFGVGSMPDSTAIAVQYGIDRNELFLPRTFQDLLSMLRNKKVDPDKIFTFFYDWKSGLQNTTSNTRNSLFDTKRPEGIVDITNLNLPSSSPLLIKYRIQSQLSDTKIKYIPGGNEFQKYIAYLESQERYYAQAQVSSYSEWKYNEIRNIKDDDVITSWMGHRGLWHDGKTENVTIELDKTRKIGGVKMVLGPRSNAPIDYVYFCSTDKLSWKELGRFGLQPTVHSDLVINKFPDANCRWVKLDIKSTFSDDSPQIAEIEVLDSEFKDLDLEKAKLIKNDPFAYLESDADRIALKRYLLRNGAGSKICFHTDKTTQQPTCQDFKLMIDSNRYYSIVMSASGSVLNKIEIVSIPRIETRISDVSVYPLSYNDLVERDYILDYSEN